MLAVLCSSPRPPLGVALLGLTIIMLRWVLHLLPYVMFCGMITLSVWLPSQPLPPDVSYYTVNGHPTVYTRIDYQPSKEARSFELNAGLRILVFLLAIPVTSVVENAFFRPARGIFLRTIECWFDMRYVHPAQISGTWPSTWTPIFNALRSCEFVADFIDGATGRNSGPILARTAEARTSGPFSSGSDSIVQPAERRAPSRQCKRVSSPDPIVYNGLEGATNTPRPRKTFVSPPHVSPQSPWNANGLEGFSPVSKNLSRIVGILYHRPPPRKPIIRHQIDLLAKVPSAHVQPHVLEHLWSRNDSVASAWASMSSLGTAICNSQVSWHDGAQLLRSAWDHISVVPELGEHIAGGSLPLSIGSRFLPGTPTTEQTQSEQQPCWGYMRSPLTSLFPPEPPVQTLLPNFVSDWQEGQYIQPWSVQTPVHHGFSYQDQHITTSPVCKQQELDHQLFHGFPSGLDSVTLAQHGSHVYPGGPERQMADQQLLASLTPVIEPPLPPFSSLPVASQEQFTFQLLDNVPLFQFSEDHKPSSTSRARTGTPEMACTSDRYATTAVFVPSQDELSHPPSWPMPFDARPETVWPNYHHRSPTITSPVFRSQHIAQPFLGLRIAGTFTFDVSPVVPYFDFSHHLPPASPNGIELDVIPQATTPIPFQSDSQDMNDAWPPISANREYLLQHLSFNRGVQIQQVPRNIASQPQGDVSNLLPRPFAPAEQSSSARCDTAIPSISGAKMSVDRDDGDDSGSDSDCSDSSSDTDSDSDTDMDSDSDSTSSDDDSDSDSDSDSSEDENDAVVAEPVCKTSSPPDASSKAQDDVQGVPTDKATSAKDDGADSDSDSDDDEYTPTPTVPPGAANDDDESSSSDEDMSDHEEEDRLYWERFYMPRHRRQPDL